MLTIIVPYRDREDHLHYFTHHLKWFFSVRLIVVEQADDKPFNRGKLLNIGFIESVTAETNAVCFNDVDMIPQKDYPNFWSKGRVIQLATSSIQKKDYLGGATMFTTEAFLASQGYHNDYFHRAEDNEMMFNLQRKKIRVVNEIIDFRNIPHPRSSPEFIPELWQKAQLPRNINMLENCKYELISKEIHDTHTHLKVRL